MYEDSEIIRLQLQIAQQKDINRLRSQLQELSEKFQLLLTHLGLKAVSSNCAIVELKRREEDEV